MAHCQRDMLQAQWRLLLDDEFLHAYAHGIVIECCDGVKRRFYPRIFTYSADYPEKSVFPLFDITEYPITQSCVPGSFSPAYEISVVVLAHVA